MLPHFWRSDRNLNMLYAETPKRIHYRIDDGGGRSDSPRILNAFCTERMVEAVLL